MPHGGVDLDGVEAERAVAGRHHHMAVRETQGSAAMPNGTPMPMQPNGPGSSMVAADRPTRAKLRKSPPSTMTMASAVELRPESRPADGSDACARRRRAAAAAIDSAQLVGALFVRAREGPAAQSRSTAGPVAGASRRSPPAPPPDCASISTSPRRLSRSSEAASAMRRKRAGAEDRGRAVSKLEVESAADRDDEIGLAHRPSAHRRDRRGMVVRHEAAAFAGVEVDGAEAVEQPHKLGPGSPRAAPADDERPARGPQQIDRRRDGCGIGQKQRPRLWPKMLLELQRAAGTSPRSVSAENRDRPGRARRLRRTRARPPRRVPAGPAPARARCAHSA